MDRWERFARWYDLDQGTFEEDLAFYLSLARRTGSPILELGCGTGRLVLALGRAGHQVVGVDYVAPMLDRARAKVEAADPAVARQVHLVQADFCRLDLSRRFALAILAVNTLMHVDDPQKQAAVIRRAFHHLRPGGWLVVDLFHPHPAALVPAEGELVLEKTLADPETGMPVLKFVARQVDHARQVIETTFLYDQVDAEGQVRRTVVPFSMRYLHRSEGEHMLQSAGFRIENVYGSYDLDPYGDASERMIWLARRPEERAGGQRAPGYQG